MNQIMRLDRRQFISSALATGGALVIGIRADGANNFRTFGIFDSVALNIE